MKHLLILLLIPSLAWAEKPIESLTGDDLTAFGNAVRAGIADDPVASRTAAGVDESTLCNSRLARFRERLDTITASPVIAFFGDSMLEAYSTNIKLRDAFHGEFGMGGYAFLDANTSGGAASISTTFTHWFKGRFVRLTGSGHTAAVNVDNLLPVESNTLKLYYVRKPGGGTFKVQTRRNGGSWDDETSYLTVSTDGAVAGQIITITKTNPRSVWEIRAVWVSGGECDIIGGGLYDTASTGARIAMLQAGSTDLNQWISAPSAVSQPIIADIAPHLCILSHLDGAAHTGAYQATWQDSVNTWAATTPTWLVIGPPVGPNESDDAARVAQASAQRTLANSRNDAFWDNRSWANSTPAEAITRGFLYTSSDPHYTPLAQRNWIPKMLGDTGLAESAYRRTASGKAEMRLLKSPVMRKSRRTGTNDEYAMELNGDLEMGPPIGNTGYGRLFLWDMDGPSSTSDFGQLYYQGDTLIFGTGATARFGIYNSIGLTVLSAWGSTEATPIGKIGIHGGPMQDVVTKGLSCGYRAVTTNYTLIVSDYTVNVTANSPTITLPLSTTTGFTTRNDGRIYVIKNSGAGTVTLATTSAQTIDGGSPGTLATGQSIKVQSTGTGWITIP